MKTLATKLSKTAKKLLSGTTGSLPATFTYAHIETLFKHEEWKAIALIEKHVDKEKIPPRKLSMYYYICGRAYRIQKNYQQALQYQAKSLSYNDIKPNSPLWQYTLALLHLRSPKELTANTILEPFVAHGYKVTTITFDLVEAWFKKERYDKLLIVCTLVEKYALPQKNLGDFYFIWGSSLKELGRSKEALDKFKLAQEHYKTSA